MQLCALCFVFQVNDLKLNLRARQVIPTSSKDFLYSYSTSENGIATPAKREWCVYLQAGAGIVADSSPEKEYDETVNKVCVLSKKSTRLQKPQDFILVWL